MCLSTFLTKKLDQKKTGSNWYHGSPPTKNEHMKIKACEFYVCRATHHLVKIQLIQQDKLGNDVINF